MSDAPARPPYGAFAVIAIGLIVAVFAIARIVQMQSAVPAPAAPAPVTATVEPAPAPVVEAAPAPAPSAAPTTSSAAQAEIERLRRETADAVQARQRAESEAARARAAVSPVGSWSLSQRADGDSWRGPWTDTFRSDGTFTGGDQDGTWSQRGNSVYFRFDRPPHLTYNVTISGNTMNGRYTADGGETGDVRATRQ